METTRKMRKLKKLVSIRVQIFVTFFVVTLLIAAVFSPYGCYTNIHSIRSSVDERLKTAAYGVQAFLPPDYVDRMFERKVSEEEYNYLRDKISDYCEDVGISYLYIIIQNADGKFFFIMDNSPKPFEEYLKPTPDILKAFRTKRTVVSQGYDSEFGILARSALLPFTSKNGHFYIVGADVNVSYIRPMILKSLDDFLFIMLCGIVLVGVVTFFLARRISRPIRLLSDFTVRLAENGFSKDIKLRGDGSKMALTSEVALLYRNISTMRMRLFEYIGMVKEAVRAKERAESELKIAGQIQRSFLPENSFSDGEIKVYASMKPAREVGGDLYDFFKLPDGRICLVVGDVSGKGMPAALFMARAVTSIRAAAGVTSSLKKMVNIINEELCRNNYSCTFLTLFAAAYNPRSESLDFVNCGHNPPFIMRAGSDSVSALKPKPNSVLGVFEDSEFAEESVRFGKGDRLLIYTDGVTEAIGRDGSFFGETRSAEFLAGIPKSATARDMSEGMLREILNFEKECEQSDDITIVAVVN